MELEAVLVSNGAAVVDGLLHVQGAGWESWPAPLFPAAVVGCISGIAVLEGDERGGLPELYLEISGEGDDDLSPCHGGAVLTGTRPPPAEGVPYRAPFVIAFSTVAQRPTIATARLSTGDEDLAALTFAVVSTTPDAPPDE